MHLNAYQYFTVLEILLTWIFCIDDCVLASEFKLNKPDLDVKVNNVKLMGRCKVRIENSIHMK